MPHEILVDWSAPGGTGFRSVTYWDQNVPIGDQRAALSTFLGGLDLYIDSNCTWLIETTGRVQNDETGTLTGMWTDNTVATGVGAAVGDCVPDAAQMLLRWNASAIVNGRFLRGRTFIPGWSNTFVTDGNVNVATRTAVQTLINTFIAANVGFGVWHRPVASAGGLLSDVASGSSWTDFAVLRRRRNG